MSSQNLEIPQSAWDFLSRYGGNPYDRVSGSERGDLICVYKREVEPFFWWHFNGPAKIPGSLVDTSKCYSNSRHYNYPADWEWRSYLVKDLARWRCTYCYAFKGDEEKPLLEADHIVEAVRWRPADLFGAPFVDPLVAQSNARGPHDLLNLQCLCTVCHDEKHGFYVERS